VRRRVGLALIAITVVAAVMRLWGWPELPAGLGQDEISAGYEGWALLTRGTDRWGMRWPVYFLSWGSGQNVLYSYLSIPFLAIFGPTTVALRAVAQLFGIGLVPLLYWAVRAWYRPRVALIASLLLAVVPWHVMLSRWGLESNLLPFFLTFGVGALGHALKPRAPRWLVVVALVPFAIALYAYAMSVFVVPILLVIAALLYRRRVTRRIWPWAASLVLFLVVAAPFGLFVLDNQVLHGRLGVEGALPFGVPLLEGSRLSEVAGGWLGNLAFVARGFDDGLPWNAVPGWWPIPALVLLAAVGGIVVAVQRLVRRRSYRDLFAVLLVACIPLGALVHLDINRANAVFVPLIVCAAVAIDALLRTVRRFVPRRSLRAAFAVVMVAALAVPTVGFAMVYAGDDYRQRLDVDFNPSLPAALAVARSVAGDRPLYVTSSLSLGYVQVLWYERVPVPQFLAGSPTTSVPDFGPYVFAADRIVGETAYLVRESETAPCASPAQERVVSDRWRVGVCPG
jgi:4-amino-4-deoxy-L-arabinose transferase-like glycosyltransferase